MKIALDYISGFSYGGNSIYTRELIKALNKEDCINYYYLCLYWKQFFKKNKLNLNSNFNFSPVFWRRLHQHNYSFLNNTINKFSLNLFINAKDIDILHFTNPLNFIKTNNKKIVTIHDLSPLHNKKWAKEKSVNFFKTHIRDILYHSEKIIAVSDYTKKDILKFFNIEEAKIKVIYEGVSDSFYPNIDRNYMKKKYGLDEYILYVGALSLRKNIINLLKSYSKLSNNLKKKYKLVLAGKPKNKDVLNNIKKNIKELNIEDNVFILGFMSSKDLPKIYSQAKIFIYPSLFEGFGLPILESLSCGTPVITSNYSSLPEVVGEAGLLVDTKKTDELAESIERLLIDETFYQELKNKSFNQISKFSWSKTAKETLEVYQEVYEK